MQTKTPTNKQKKKINPKPLLINDAINENFIQQSLEEKEWNQENERLCNATLLCVFLDKEIELESNFTPWEKVIFEKAY